jgi:hypothetical protein
VHQGAAQIQTTRQLGKEIDHLRSAHSSLHNDPAFSIDTMHLEHVLRQIQADCANSHRGWLPSVARPQRRVWHFDAVSAGVQTH